MLQLNFNPFPAIKTEHLVLREITMQDVDDIFTLRSNDDAMRHIGKAKPRNTSEIVDMIVRIQTGIKENASIGWAITLKGNNHLLGTIGFHRIEIQHQRAEIGYMIMPQFWNKGYITEAIKATVNFGFENMKLHSIEALISPENLASEKVLLKNNFVKEAHFKQNYFFENTFFDTAVLSLLNPHYATTK